MTEADIDLPILAVTIIRLIPHGASDGSIVHQQFDFDRKLFRVNLICANARRLGKTALLIGFEVSFQNIESASVSAGSDLLIDAIIGHVVGENTACAAKGSVSSTQSVLPLPKTAVMNVDCSPIAIRITATTTAAPSFWLRKGSRGCA
tara:strand:+ start:2186 stop:2629 length:444 start_codon:yes stop_codon:yes gene_type:complete